MVNNLLDIFVNFDNSVEITVADGAPDIPVDEVMSAIRPFSEPLRRVHDAVAY